MTDEERNAAIGALVVEYEENERRIGTLSSVLHRIGEDLRHLGMSLQGDRSDIVATESSLIISVRGDRRSVPCSSVSFDGLGDHIETWHRALANRERLEDCLRQAGLEKLIRK